MLLICSLLYIQNALSAPVDACQMQEQPYVQLDGVEWLTELDSENLEAALTKPFKPFNQIDSLSNTIWSKFQLKNTCQQELSVYLQNWYSEYVTIYSFNQAGLIIDTLKSGYLTPQKELSLKDNYKQAELQIPAGETRTYLIKVETHFNNAQFSGWLLSGPQQAFNNFIESKNNSIPFEWFVLFFSGTAISIMIFVFMLFLLMKERAYLMYSIYLFGLYLYGVLGLPSYGLLNKFVAYDPSLRFHLNETFIYFSYAFYSFFIYYLFDEGKKPRKLLFKIILINGYFLLFYSIGYTIFSFTNHNVELESMLHSLIRLYSIPFGIITLAWLLVSVKSGMVKWILIGNAGFYACTVWAIILMNTEPTESTALISSRGVFLFGMFLEMVFFSVALGSKFKNDQVEKLKTRSRLIKKLKVNEQLLENMNEELEQQVSERSMQLSNIEQELALKKLQQEATEYQKKLTEAQMSTLMLQMNPHFIFNSLNSIQSMIVNKNYNGASKALTKFSKLTRKVLMASRKDFIDLEDELELLNLYVGIEKTRFEDGFKFNVHIDDDIELQDITVPPLLLQPFVENAIWHGLLHSEKAEKHLKISAKKINETQVVFEVEDNGIGRKKSMELNKERMKTRKSYGIQLISDRVNLINQNYPIQIDISYEDLNGSAQNTGTRVILEYKYELVND